MTKPRYGNLPLSGAVRLSQVQRRSVRWLWERRIPFGKITVIDGDPGNGKSVLTLDITARTTTGTPFPDHRGDVHFPSSVILLSAEDDASDTIRPRLEAAGANLDRVTILQDVPLRNGERRPPILPGDLELVEKLIAEDEASLVIVDPLMAFLDGGIDSSRDQDVRRALHSMKEMAERTGAAIVLVRHLNKSVGGSAIYRGGGSIGIIGAARSGLVVAKDPEDETRRIIAPIKSNLGPEAASLAYRVVSAPVLECAVVKWEGVTNHRASDLLSDQEESGALADAKDFLRDLLELGPVSAKDGMKRAKDAGISERTLKRAKAQMNVRSEKQGAPGEDQAWFWVLPEEGQESPKSAKSAKDPGRHPSEGDHAEPLAPLAPFEESGTLRMVPDELVCDVCQEPCTFVDDEGRRIHVGCKHPGTVSVRGADLASVR